MKDKKILIVIIISCLLTTGCMKNSIERSKITKNAKDYFSTKYNIKKSKIKISYNGFYGPSTYCLPSCGENQATIIYNEKTYHIKYDSSRKTYGDDYQYETIKNDFHKYLVENFPYAKTITIDMLEDDVLETPTKYTGNIENYIKNTMIRTNANDSAYTKVAVWIETDDPNQAKELSRKYRKELITKLNSLNISYSISFAKTEGRNESASFYYYTVRVAESESTFMYWDRVDHNNGNSRATTTCNGKSISFNDDEIICN